MDSGWCSVLPVLFCLVLHASRPPPDYKRFSGNVMLFPLQAGSIELSSNNLVATFYHGPDDKIALCWQGWYNSPDQNRMPFGLIPSLQFCLQVDGESNFHDVVPAGFFIRIDASLLRPPYNSHFFGHRYVFTSANLWWEYLKSSFMVPWCSSFWDCCFIIYEFYQVMMLLSRLFIRRPALQQL